MLWLWRILTRHIFNLWTFGLEKRCLVKRKASKLWAFVWCFKELFQFWVEAGIFIAMFIQKVVVCLDVCRCCDVFCPCVFRTCSYLLILFIYVYDMCIYIYLYLFICNIYNCSPFWYCCCFSTVVDVAAVATVMCWGQRMLKHRPLVRNWSGTHGYVPPRRGCGT